MARQKCVMNAMLHQLSPKQVVLKFGDIAKASTAMVKTDIPASELDRFMALALKARGQAVRTVSFVPPMIDTYRPDIAKTKKIVDGAISPSTKPHARRAAKAAPKPGTTGGSYGNIHDGYAANQANDLGAAC
jgi:hypothetical protein